MELALEKPYSLGRTGVGVRVKRKKKRKKKGQKPESQSDSKHLSRWEVGAGRGSRGSTEIRILFPEQIPGNLALSKTASLTVIVVRVHSGREWGAILLKRVTDSECHLNRP